MDAVTVNWEKAPAVTMIELLVPLIAVKKESVAVTLKTLLATVEAVTVKTPTPAVRVPGVGMISPPPLDKVKSTVPA